MILSFTLKRAGLFTGPSCKETRHSDLSVVKALLLGRSTIHTKGRKTVNRFGRAAHYEWLIQKRCREKISADEREMLNAMLSALQRNKIAVWLRDGAICEVRKKCKINGVRLGYTPDAVKHHRKITGSDLKTTACGSREDFIASCIKYGYFRQDVTYTKAYPLNDYWIVGIQKTKTNPKVYLVYTNDFPEERNYADQELDWLLYIHQHYGTPKKKVA